MNWTRCLLSYPRNGGFWLHGLALWTGLTATVCGQGFPAGSPAPSAPAASSPNSAAATPPVSNPAPRYVQIIDPADPAPSQGQVWREYDLRPYLTRVRGMDSPMNSVMDWLLRETGTDRWFGDTPGMISFEGDKLRVYHLPEVHDTVAAVLDRFVNPELSKYAVSVRLITVENTAWRSMALPFMEAVRVETPGIQAWTVSRENAARLSTQLRSLVEYRVHNSTNVQVGHGQSHTIERWQPRTYPERVQTTPTNYPGYQLLNGQIQEGFSLQLSPLAVADGSAMEVVIKCQAEQIEKMTPVTINVSSGNAPLFGGGVQIEVPQVSSWRVHERFRWPMDQVLVISRGRVAMPGMRTDNGLPFASMLPTTPVRADVLLILDCKEMAAGSLAGEGESARVGRVNYHGRY